MTAEDRIRAFVSLCRYRSWSVSLRAIVAPTLREYEDGAQQLTGPLVAFLNYGFASLFVISEGWRELKIPDERIANVLSEDHLEVLRRYRNGVFHFQRDFGDDRFLGILQAGTDTLRRVKELDAAYDAFFAPHEPKPNVRLIEHWVRSGE